MRGKAKRPGTCAACHKPYQRGDRVVGMSIVHWQCAGGGGFSAIPPAPTLEFTRLKALAALEEAIQSAAQVNGVSDVLEKQWQRYEKLKASGLNPGSPNEEKLAFRNALVDAVKMVF